LGEKRFQNGVVFSAMIEDRKRLGKRAGDSMKQNVASGTFANAKQGFSGVPRRGGSAHHSQVLHWHTFSLVSSSFHQEFSCRPPLASRFA
jgi:hypothetical protein